MAAVVSVRLGDEDQQELKAMADARGVSVSDLVREAVAKDLRGHFVVTAPQGGETSVGGSYTAHHGGAGYSYSAPIAATSTVYFNVETGAQLSH